MKNFADTLKNATNTVTKEHFFEFLYCLPPQITNFKQKKFPAFLLGEPYTHKFCNFAKKIVPLYQCFATASDGTHLCVGVISEAEFTKKFIDN